MRRFDVVVRTRVNGAIQVRTAEAIAKSSIEAMCNVVRMLAVDGPISTSVKLHTPPLTGGAK